MVHIKRICDKCGSTITFKELTELVPEDTIISMNGFVIIPIKFVCSECVTPDLSREAV